MGLSGSVTSPVNPSADGGGEEGGSDDPPSVKGHGIVFDDPESSPTFQDDQPPANDEQRLGTAAPGNGAGDGYLAHEGILGYARREIA